MKIMRPVQIVATHRPRAYTCRSQPPKLGSASPLKKNPITRSSRIYDQTRDLKNKITRAMLTQSMKAATAKLNVPTQNLTVKIFSNWGNSERIACAEIVPIDEERKHIQIINSIATPKEATEIDPRKLQQGLYSYGDQQSNENDIWWSPWPLKSPIEIVFVLPNDKKIKMVRFFNPQIENNDAGIKAIEIYLEGDLVWKGDIPNNLGFVARLDKKKFAPNEEEDKNENKTHNNANYNTSTMNGHNTFRNLPKSRSFTRNQSCHFLSEEKKIPVYIDKFGQVPQIASSMITIEFVSPYDTQGITCGLSGIEILTTKKELIDETQIANVLVFNGSVTSAPSTLFRGHYLDPKIEEMWVIDRTSEELNPSIVILLQEKTLVGQIRLWNYFFVEMKYQTKNVLIKLDETPVYYGRLKEGDGTIKNINHSVTNIHVNEMDYRFVKKNSKSAIPKIPH
ncbi:hypothetical protein TRFO_28224 [Tritrichomonas foetus]|uniref:KATNIP domain-containing protein n=1 Tax=Tritrichomonas foetus TaxID=1144522 RepID=A0A1J4K022_9EUKA|nr:hypothetical protein TRFO_28224 [Tritrichomonas foetus]|eukprot:OHT04290.1 hypothetical protein TRFO_28224 [Tritrichomonas foetus]